ncbi:MAG: hypothetical protein ACK5IJ_04315 [Mangrovibacterium sp.]
MSFLTLLIVAFTFVSCNKEDDLGIENTPPETENSENMMVLGAQLENPYSVENMQKALQELQSSGMTLKSNIVIEPTHLYVRFLPASEEELQILKADTLLELYSYPLDYEIGEGGSYYQDPSLPDSVITWQYTTVAPNYEFPNIKYELLCELFLLEEDDDDSAEISTKNGKINLLDWEALEDKSLELTGNLDEGSDDLTEKASKWRPAGCITMWDECSKSAWVPIEGLEVRARRWFTTHKGITSSTGAFSCDGRFRRDANYSFSWERYNFEIRNSGNATAQYNGPKKRGYWSYDIVEARDAMQVYHATIFRAAYHYYYKDINSLRRPPQNSFWKTQLKIRAYYEENTSANGNHAAWRRFLGLGSAVRIYNPQRATQDIYGTTIHELAHASHWNMSSSTFNDTETIVKESWARGVQLELTRMVYPDYKGGSIIRPYYTQVVVDMIDLPFDNNNGSELLSQDNVSGYTIKEIEDALKGQKTWNGWRDNIKNKYNNETEKYLDALFEHWGN